MATAALLRALRRPSTQITLLQSATGAKAQAMVGYRHFNRRNLSILNEISKQLKGEAKRNPEFEKSISELNAKFASTAEVLKVRTKKTTEKIYNSVDDVWTEAEATSKKVSENLKENLSAAKEEVKGTFTLGKEEISKDTFHKTSAHEKTKVFPDSNYETQDPGSSAALFSRLKSKVSSASLAVSNGFAKLKDTRVSTLAKKGYDTVKHELNSGRNKKNYFRPHGCSVASVERSTRTDIVIVPTNKSILGEKWELFKNKMWGHPICKTVNEYTKPVVTLGQEVAEDVQERWETSDNPVVHKIQDLNDLVVSETASAASYREIQQLDPSFSLPDFVADVQESIKPVLVAYAKGDTETLKHYCSKEVIDRCKGERQAYTSHNMFFDNKILHISEAHVREAKMLGSTPVIILEFQTQQIHCVRDREGQITEGGQNTIKTVLYAWAMQLMDSDELPEVESYYPVWRLCGMQQVGVKALI